MALIETVESSKDQEFSMFHQPSGAYFGIQTFYDIRKQIVL